jgi:hypothetical protein
VTKTFPLPPTAGKDCPAELSAKVHVAVPICIVKASAVVVEFASETLTANACGPETAGVPEMAAVAEPGAADNANPAGNAPGSTDHV